MADPGAGRDPRPRGRGRAALSDVGASQDRVARAPRTRPGGLRRDVPEDPPRGRADSPSRLRRRAPESRWRAPRGVPRAPHTPQPRVADGLLRARDDRRRHLALRGRDRLRDQARARRARHRDADDPGRDPRPSRPRSSRPRTCSAGHCSRTSPIRRPAWSPRSSWSATTAPASRAAGSLATSTPGPSSRTGQITVSTKPGEVQESAWFGALGVVRAARLGRWRRARRGSSRSAWRRRAFRVADQRVHRSGEVHTALRAASAPVSCRTGLTEPTRPRPSGS